MAAAYILSTDKLQSGFRAKYNLSVAEIITGFTDNGDGTVTVAKFNGTTFTIDFTDSFYTKAEITDLLAALVVGILIDDTANANGEYDASGDGLPEFPNVTIYGADNKTSTAQYDNDNKLITGLNALETFTAKFSGL